MTNRSMSEASIQELVYQFAELSIRRGLGIELWKPTSYVDELGERMFAIGGELSKRSGDQRVAFSELFSHPNGYVRFDAAVASISVLQAEARAVIQAIAESGVYPLAGEAGVFLSMYDGELSKLKLLDSPP